MKSGRINVAIFAGLMAAAPLICGDSLVSQTSDGVRQVEIHQAQIKTQVQQAADDLTSIITDLQRNGIGGDDLAVLQNIHGNLDSLSGVDMAKVIGLLQQARAAGEASHWRKQTTQADVDQAQILVEMRKVLLEYKRQQDLYDMSLRLNDLAQRQNVNFKEAKQMMRMVGGAVNPDSLNELMKSSRERQVGEQQAVANETKMLTDKLGQMVSQADANTADRLRQCLEQANREGLNDSLGVAVVSLKDFKLGEATTAQKDARDALYDLASLVAPAQDSATRLAKAAEKLDQAIAEQKGIAGQTHDLTPPREEGDKDAFYQVEDREADNVDVIDRLRRNLDVIAPAVTDSLKGVQNKMQDSRAALRSFQPDTSLQREQEALSGLQQAKELLDQQMQDWDAKKRQGDSLAQTQQLKEKINQALQKQQQLNNQTQAAQPADAPKLAKSQDEGLKDTRDLQTQAASDSMPTAKELAAAAEDMDAAKNNLEQNSIPGAQPPQHSAVDHLAAAQKSVDRQIEKLQKAQEELAKLQKSRDEVAKLIEGEQKVALNTARQSGKSPPATQPDGKPSPNPTTSKSKPDQQPSSEQQPPLDQQQSEVAKQTQSTRDAAPEAAKSASSSLDQAHQEMSNAQKSLEQKQPQNAKPSQQQALNDLHQAKSDLDQQISQKQQELGQPQDSQQKMEQLSQQLRQTQQELSSAQEQMDQASPQESSERIGKAANQVTATTANDQGALPTSARQSLQQAAQSLDQASGDAQANQPSAKAEAQAGQNAISQALAALSQAQKGSPSPSSGHPPQGTPSPTPPSANSGSSPAPSPSPSNGNGQASGPKGGHQGSGHRQDTQANAASDGPGTRGHVTGGGAYLALPARDRQAIQQTQSEKYPEEYGPAIEEYLKNLSDQDSR